MLSTVQEKFKDYLESQESLSELEVEILEELKDLEAVASKSVRPPLSGTCIDCGTRRRRRRG